MTTVRIASGIRTRLADVVDAEREQEPEAAQHHVGRQKAEGVDRGGVVGAEKEVYQRLGPDHQWRRHGDLQDDQQPEPVLEGAHVGRMVRMAGQPRRDAGGQRQSPVLSEDQQLQRRREQAGRGRAQDRADHQRVDLHVDGEGALDDKKGAGVSRDRRKPQPAHGRRGSAGPDQARREEQAEHAGGK